MSTTHFPIEIAEGFEPIPGYVVQELLGAGGFGEVWKCSAPGGLAKAIKFVYGRLDDARAARELKSLSRIKEVRHPFLLSLERIEVIDGHLVIVTELAESSLRDRFEQCREMGLAGIPRKELLVYVKDTADALDYLYNSKAVQHLDIKPENLLLVGNRIKVADFGLLRDVRDTIASLTSLTPTYSPPEVFDGRANRQSDQYSLAILFQEMLTGKLPFDGRTPAQLAAQHLTCEPVLNSLSASDRRAVARALSKLPDKRFETCGEFIKCLIDPVSNQSGLVSRPPTARKSWDSLVDVQTSSQESDSAHDGNTLQVCAPEITRLPPLSLDRARISYRPTVFVGVGGTAARVLRHLRRRFAYRFGSPHAAPAVQMILLDTDHTAVRDASLGDEESALLPEETLLLRLQDPQAYRESLRDLESISRRWIYNIPRTRETEGLRSLGRIALLDHAPSVLKHLKWAISTATDPQSIRESSECTEEEFRQGPPRVFVIASMAGGTGGGMVLDVGYAVRQVLGELELDDDYVCGILTHSTGGQEKSRRLAASNTYVCLNELRHYSQLANDYPGEPTRGLSGFCDASGPFRSTYAVHFGDDLSTPDFDNETEKLAEYLYLNSVSPACQFFDQSRRNDVNLDDSATHASNIRTIGLFQLSKINDEITSGYVEALCKDLVGLWRGAIEPGGLRTSIKLTEWREIVANRDVDGSSESHVTGKMEETVTAFVRNRGLNVPKLTDYLRETADCVFEEETDRYFHNLVAGSLFKANAVDASLVKATCRTIDAVFGAHDYLEEHVGVEIESLWAAVDPEFRTMAATHGAAIHAWLIGLANTPSIRLGGAMYAVNSVTRYLDSLSDRAEARLGPIQHETQELRRNLLELVSGADAGSPESEIERTDVEGRVLAYAHSRFNEFSFSAIRRIVTYIKSHVQTVKDDLTLLWAQLNQLTSEFDVPSVWEEADGVERQDTDADHTAQNVEDLLLGVKLSLVRRLDRDMGRNLVQLEHGIQHGYSARIGEPKALAAKLRANARRVTAEFLAGASCVNLENILRGQGPAASELVTMCLEAATPALLRCGGATRLLLSVSQDVEHGRLVEEIRRACEYDPTVVSHKYPDMTLCFETESVPLERVATDLISNRPDYAELASRLHSRIDVDWS